MLFPLCGCDCLPCAECDLLALLVAEKEFGLTEAEMTGLLNPALHIGRCPEQVTTFIIKLSHFRQMLTGNQQKLAYKKRG